MSPQRSAPCCERGPHRRERVVAAGVTAGARHRRERVVDEDVRRLVARAAPARASRRRTSSSRGPPEWRYQSTGDRPGGGHAVEVAPAVAHDVDGRGRVEYAGRPALHDLVEEAKLPVVHGRRGRVVARRRAAALQGPCCHGPTSSFWRPAVCSMPGEVRRPCPVEEDVVPAADVEPGNLDSRVVLVDRGRAPVVVVGRSARASRSSTGRPRGERRRLGSGRCANQSALPSSALRAARSRARRRRRSPCTARAPRPSSPRTRARARRRCTSSPRSTATRSCPGRSRRGSAGAGLPRAAGSLRGRRSRTSRRGRRTPGRRAAHSTAS